MTKSMKAPTAAMQPRVRQGERYRARCCGRKQECGHRQPNALKQPAEALPLQGPRRFGSVLKRRAGLEQRLQVAEDPAPTAARAPVFHPAGEQQLQLRPPGRRSNSARPPKPTSPSTQAG